jgi:hypothetical protein
MSSGRKNPSFVAAFEPSADAAMRSFAPRFEIVDRRRFCEACAIRICDRDRDCNDGFDPPPLDTTEVCPVFYDGHFAMGLRTVALPRSLKHGVPLAVVRTPRDGSPEIDSHDELDIGGAR